MRISWWLTVFLTVIPWALLAKEQMVEVSPHLFKTGHDYFLVLEYQHKNGWHTYFKNPGDSGEATAFQFFIDNKRVELPEPLWPFPETIKYGGINTYGYSGAFALFFKLEKAWLHQTMKIKTSWLACKNICVPGLAEKEITLNQKNFHDDLRLQRYFEKLPTVINSPEKLTINLIRDEKNQKILIYYNFKDPLTQKFPAHQNFLVPLTTHQFNFGSEKLVIENERHLAGTMEGNFEGEYLEPPLAFPTLEDLRNKYLFTFLYQDPNTLQTFQLTHQFKSANPSSKVLAPSTIKTLPSVWYYILLALLGGLILNFMPCVLPVVSLKLFGLIKHQQESHQSIFFHNLAYTTGVLFCFIVLALIVFLIKSAGGQIGWGFQLQSPSFVGLMTLALFIFSLNMFGLFEFSTPGGKLMGNLRLKEGLFADFAGGILAVILSTPCSAPFLGTALAFAFAAPFFYTYALFLLIGVGLSLPFILTGIFPQMLRLLPHPGNWMNYFKKFLGLTLLLTALWLIDVLNALISLDIILLTVLPALLFIFVSLILVKRLKYLKLFFYICGFLSLLGFIISNQISSESSKIQTLKLIQQKEATGLHFEPWSPSYAYPTDQISFIDFSASWCLTCKINEEVILNTDEFKNLVKKHNIKLLLADWTSGDEGITLWLKEHGHAGVPAYFIISPKQTLYDLGETITLKEIEETIQKTLVE